MIIFLTGFAAGLVHVFTGPDHLAAIAPLSIDGKTRSWNIGFRWGLGHTGGVLLIGLFALIFRELIPTEFISSYSERLVGIVLIGIGLWGLKKAFAKKIHMHEHEHDGIKHIHFHTHKSMAGHDHLHGHNHSHAAFGVGIVHGLAGSSHVLGILPALALPTVLEAATYLGGFGTGTIIAMIIFSSSIGFAANKIPSFNIKAYQYMLSFFSFAAIGVGVFWLFA